VCENSREKVQIVRADSSAFSLTQIDAEALVRLREEGACDFELAELYFDLFYPGQYRRGGSCCRKAGI
jgi:hypothetical protein